MAEMMGYPDWYVSKLQELQEQDPEFAKEYEIAMQPVLERLASTQEMATSVEDIDTPTMAEEPTSFLQKLSDPTVLQAIGVGGKAIADARSIGKANKRMRRSQARSNLINALSKRGGARAAQQAPEPTIASGLFGALSNLGTGLERKDLLQEKRRQQSRAEKLAEQKEAEARKLANEELARREEEKLYKRGRDILKDLQEKQSQITEETIREEEREKETADKESEKRSGIVETYANFLLEVGNTSDNYTKSFEEILDLNPDIATFYENATLDEKKKLQTALLEGQNKIAEKAFTRDEEQQESIQEEIFKSLKDYTKSAVANYSTFNQLMAADPERQNQYNSLPDSYKFILKNEFAGERILLGDDKKYTANEIEIQVNLMKDAWDEVQKTPDPKQFLARLAVEGGDVTDQPGPIKQFFFPKASVYRNLRNSLSLPVASSFNDGKPTDKDYDITLLLFPKLNDNDEVANAQWEAIYELIRLKKEAESRGFTQTANTDFLSAGVIKNPGTKDVKIDFDVANTFFNKNSATDKTRTEDKPKLRFDPGAIK